MSEALAKRNADAEQLILEYLADPRPDLKDLVILHYAGMVERIARRFSGVESVDDLAQVGYIGLLNALSKFDPAAGVRFNTYATHLVAGEIKHYLRDRAQTIRHPAWLQELRHKVNRATTVLQAELGRVPTDREVAERIGVSESAVQEVNATHDMLRVASLDATPNDDDEADSDVERLDGSLVQGAQTSVEDRVVLETAMQQLRDLEREVLVLFHFDALSQTEIAARLGISCNYVSHILRQSLSKLRRILTAEEDQDRLLRLARPDQSDQVMDPETSAYTEAYFKSRLTEELHRVCSHNGVVSIVMVEITGVQNMRGFFGEQGVKEFVTDAAEFFRSSVRALDIVCRHGQHGFGIILPSTGDTAETVCQRLETKFGRWAVGRIAPNSPMKVRFGFATGPDSGRSVADLVKAALPDDETLAQAA
ncbi:MAG: sigma-70 family RNA polymerase sigma factor [Fimbriimonadaceae bacterium]|nr:sigma-70 family RNA polymerase sigma factor [Fimbriimonadaceae bacterium]